MKRRFKQVDVFTAIPYQGNPVAVVLDAEGLTTEAMQRIARWTNLSESTFVLPATQPGADYRLRIFTPGAELPFAGHPTVGSAHAVIEAGIVSRGKTALVQECAAGLLPLTIERVGGEQHIFVKVPEPALRPVPIEHHGALRELLHTDWEASAPPQIVSVGAVWVIVQLKDEPAVANLSPDLVAMTRFSNSLNVGGVTVFARLPKGGRDAVKVRSFAPAHGVSEDPVCGSGNACVGAFLAHHPQFADLLPGYSSSQGREIGRDGHVSVFAEKRMVRIGGPAVTCVDGTLEA
ncbi:MAG: PhzF family phenazine biosynthesis protein [Burkholderiales bacterium]